MSTQELPPPKKKKSPWPDIIFVLVLVILAIVTFPFGIVAAVVYHELDNR